MGDEWGVLGGFAGGLAIFLLGMQQLTVGLTRAAGDSLRLLLGRLTRNPVLALLSGMVITAMIQSSSVTTVILVGFVAAGMIRFRDSLAVVLGANIGSTITAQIIAFNIGAITLPMVAAGFALSQWKGSNGTRVAAWGIAVMGTGLVFFGMELMSQAARPLAATPGMVEMLAEAGSNLWIGLAAGIAATAILQSSAATTAMVLVLAGQGLITLEGGIALALGANVGTCITAVIAAIGKSRSAIRTAMGHVLFNLLGAVIWLPFIPELAALARWAALLLQETPTIQREIANAHSLFNILNALAALPLLPWGAALLERLVPERSDSMPEGASRYLRLELLQTPELALSAARQDILEQAINLRAALASSVESALHGRQHALEERVQTLRDMLSDHLALFDYLRRIAMVSVSPHQAEEQVRYLRAVSALAGLRETIQNGLLRIGLERIEANVTASEATAESLRRVHLAILEAMDRAIEAFSTGDPAKAVAVRASKRQVKPILAEAQARLMQRLMSDDPNRARTFHLESDLLHELKTAFGFVRGFGRTVEGTP